MAEGGPSSSGRRVRYYCHKCKMGVRASEDYICPYCAEGFIEIMENEVEARPGTSAEEDFSDTDMSTHEEHDPMGDLAEDENSDDSEDNTPMRRSALVEELYYVIGGDSDNASADPYALLRQEGYNVAGISLDEIVSQLLSQLENAGPPPLPRAEVDALQGETVSAERAATNAACTICWEVFVEGENVTILSCEHAFHRGCIRSWLLIHATCPICRHSLISEEPYLELMVPSAESMPIPRLILRRITRRLGVQQRVATVENPEPGCSSYNPATLSGAGDLLPDDEETEETRTVVEPPNAEASQQAGVSHQAEVQQQDDNPPQNVEQSSDVNPEPEPEPEVEPKTASCEPIVEKEPEPNMDIDKEEDNLEFLAAGHA